MKKGKLLLALICCAISMSAVLTSCGEKKPTEDSTGSESIIDTDTEKDTDTGKDTDTEKDTDTGKDTDTEKDTDTDTDTDSDTTSDTESEKTKYTVIFDSNGGTTVEAQEIVEGGKVEKPTDPVKRPTDTEDYTFIGWFVGETEWNFTTDTVTENITLVAKYSVKYSTEQYE